MSHISKIRIPKDFMDMVYSIKKDVENKLCYEEECNCDLSNLSKMNKFVIILKGPEGTPYENGKFKLEFNIPNNYPEAPPNVKFLTNIFHPNINGDKICLDILSTNWKPTYNLIKVLNALYYLLKNPNSDDPLSPDVNRVYRFDYNKFVEIAKEYTIKYAK